MKRFIAVIAAMFTMQTNLMHDAHAAAASPLDRPIEDIKRDITAIVHCRWFVPAPLIQTCEDPDERRGSWIHLVTTADGKIDHIKFQSLVFESIGADRQRQEAIYSETRRARADQAAAIVVIKKLWPSWTTGPSWLKYAFKGARKKDFQDSVRVGDTLVYVTETAPVTSDNHFASVVLTKKTDLTEFKNLSCSDDDQGPGLDSCTDRDGQPRPPENPILHPK